MQVTNLAYRRPSSTLLANWVYLLVEDDGAQYRTAPVRRSARPHWGQTVASLVRADSEPGTTTGLRVTLLDLAHNIVGSGHHHIPVSPQASRRCR